MLLNFFRRHKKVKEGEIFAVLQGEYRGEFFVFMEENGSEYVFFSLPDKLIRNVPKKAFDNGINSNIIEFIERIPKPQFGVVKKEYSIIIKK